jgi:hypothetical protein
MKLQEKIHGFKGFMVSNSTSEISGKTWSNTWFICETVGM